MLRITLLGNFLAVNPDQVESESGQNKFDDNKMITVQCAGTVYFHNISQAFSYMYIDGLLCN